MAPLTDLLILTLLAYPEDICSSDKCCTFTLWCDDSLHSRGPAWRDRCPTVHPRAFSTASTGRRSPGSVTATASGWAWQWHRHDTIWGSLEA